MLSSFTEDQGNIGPWGGEGQTTPWVVLASAQTPAQQQDAANRDQFKVK